MAILLLGNILFYEAKNQELSVQGVEGKHEEEEERERERDNALEHAATNNALH